MQTHSTACLDWRERIVARQSLIPPPIFPDEAAAALNVFKSLKIVDAPGKPSFGDACEDFVFEFVAAIFGAYDATAARRLIREFFLLISKKNSKSTIAAGIMLTALIRNWRHSAELLILAPTKEVANNSFGPAKDMIAEDPELRNLLRVQDHTRTITHRITEATLQVVAADSETVSGKKASFVLIDELWLFGRRANARNMLREATGGLASRPEGFVIALSTQSDDPPAGVFLDWLRRFRDIRDGKLIAPRSLGVLYEFPEDMIKSGAYKKPENFYVTNPNLGLSVDKEFLLDEYAKAQREGSKSLVGFFAKHLNVEPGMGARSDNWVGADFWKRTKVRLTLADILDRCEVVVVGLDGGGRDDLYGMTVLGRESIEVEIAADAPAGAAPDVSSGEAIGLGTKKRVKRWLSWSHAWAHRIVLSRRQTIASLLEDFERAGELTFQGAPEVGGELSTDLDELDGVIENIDLAEIIDLIVQIRDAGILCCVAVDPAGLGELIDALAEVGIVEENKETGRDYVIGAAQGYAMMNALKTAERKLTNGTLRHADQALMDWCIGNLKIEPTATAIRATKQNAGDAKIDPAMALFNAVTIMATNPEAVRSAYEEHGLLFV